GEVPAGGHGCGTAQSCSEDGEGETERAADRVLVEILGAPVDEDADDGEEDECQLGTGQPAAHGSVPDPLPHQQVDALGTDLLQLLTGGRVVAHRGVGPDLGQWPQDELAIRRQRVGDGEAVVAEGRAVVRDDVDVERARPPIHRSLPPALSLDLETGVEEPVRLELGLQQDDRVQERVLLGPSDRLGLVEGRPGGDLAELGESGVTGPKVLETVAEVRTEADGVSGHRLRSIVTEMSRNDTSTGASGLWMVTKETGKHLEPHEFMARKDRDDVVVLAVRSNYEHNVGRFKNALTLDIDNFREFPEKIAELEAYKDKKILTYCTGGIKCEKASALLLKSGFADVYQLHGGIIKYGKEAGGKDFEGKCYVFDNRVTVDVNRVNPTEV